MTDDVVIIRNGRVKAARGFRDQTQQRPIGAIPHQKTEDSHIILFQQFRELRRFDETDVGDAVGNQHETRRTVRIERAQPFGKAGIEIGTAFNFQRPDLFDRRLNRVRSRGGPGNQFSGAVTKYHDAKPVFRPHLAECLADSASERAQLALHRARYIEHVNEVGPVADGLQVYPRRHYHHKGAGLVRARAVRNHLHPTRQIFRQAIIEHEIAIEFSSLATERHLVVAFINLLRGGGRLKSWHAHIGNRHRRLQFNIHQQLAADLRTRGPEIFRDIVRATVLQRIQVAPHSRIDLKWLIVDEAEFHLGVGADRRDFEFVSLITVLRR